MMATAPRNGRTEAMAAWLAGLEAGGFVLEAAGGYELDTMQFTLLDETPSAAPVGKHVPPAVFARKGGRTFQVACTTREYADGLIDRAHTIATLRLERLRAAWWRNLYEDDVCPDDLAGLDAACEDEIREQKEGLC